MEPNQAMHIMAIGVHPDDVELGCSGTLIRHIQKGQRVVIVDLTQGELGSRGSIETRYNEAERSARLMQVTERVNLKFRDGFFENDEAHRLRLITMIRHYRPAIVLANAYHDRHPDHGRASQLIEDACFLSGLRKIVTEYEGKPQEAYRPSRVFHYIQDRYIRPDFIIDISEQMELKIKAIQCFDTQFMSATDDGEPITYISRPSFLEQVKGRAKEFGHAISVEYGEGFCCKAALGLSDLDGFLYPDMV